MERRTSLITAAAVGGALLVGSGAIAANIGVLNSADDDSIGNLTADVADQTPATTEAQVIDIYLEDTPLPTTPTSVVASADVVQRQYAVERAGTVTVSRTPTGLFVSDVTVNQGWSWSTDQSASSALDVTFVSGDSIYLFHAEIDAAGQIAARVDQPIVNTVQAPASPASGSSNDVARYEHDDDDDEHEYDDHEDDDDDDHDDYEGGDDDD